MNQEIALIITLESPTAGVDFGIQKGSGSKYETHQIQRSGKEDLQFSLKITLKSKIGNPPDFSGPMVQGPPGNRFIYIDIGTAAGQIGTLWSRRLKIPLKGIAISIVEELQADPRKILETKIAGTGKDGGPNCGTVKPFPGWQVRTQKS